MVDTRLQTKQHGPIRPKYILNDCIQITAWGLIRFQRMQVAGVLIALSLSIMMLDTPLSSAWLPFAYILIGFALIISPRRPDLTTSILVGMIILSAFVALFTTDALTQTGFLLISTVFLSLIGFTKIPTWILSYLGYLSLLVSASVYWASFHGAFRASGILFTANQSASLLVLGWLMLVTSQRWYLSIIPASALMFSGSRWATVVFIILSLVVGFQRKYSWRVIFGLCAATITVLIAGDQIQAALRTNEGDLIPSAIMDVQTRIATDNIPAFKPQGFITQGNVTPHSVPLRIAIETGILSAVAWLGLIVWTVYKTQPRPRLLMIGVALLSVLYYLTWVGPLGGWYWIAVSQTRDKCQR